MSKFHGGVIDVTTALEEATGVPLTRLTDHLYVHYEDRRGRARLPGRLRAGLDGGR